MIREPLTMFCYNNFSGQVRGKGFPSRLLEKRLKSGMGWTPTNIMFTPHGSIAPSPWGAHGDLRFMADPATAVDVDFQDGTAAERFLLCDTQQTDGSPWECCPRSLLKAAVEQLEREAGIVLGVTFEHEFIYSGANARAGDCYALGSIRRHGSFGETLIAALHAATLEPDSYLPEFAPGQFEVTLPPSAALKACDSAVILKELVRATAFRFGETVSFSPRLTPDGIGNGVHIHFSLWDLDGRPLSYDPARPFGMSAIAGRFLSGIIRHMPALCAFTAPSPVSYLRLVPHSWTGAWSNVGYRDREAAIRICPTFGGKPEDEARQYNFEYRAADATGNPYLQLAMIMRAGLAGFTDGLDAPVPTEGQDPEAMSQAEREERGIRRLPESLGAALGALEQDSRVSGFMPPMLLEAYLATKRAELAVSTDWSPDELCRRYAELY